MVCEDKPDDRQKKSLWHVWGLGLGKGGKIREISVMVLSSIPSTGGGGE
jgi:hypothetical protein